MRGRVSVQVTAILATAVLAVVVAGSAARAEPHRVVSLNPCLDAILVAVADRDQIAAVSHFSHDPATTSAGRAGLSLPFTYGSAEEVVALRPDLVLAPRYSAQATLAALGRLKVRTVLFDVPDTVDQNLDQVMQVARAVGHPERGRALVGRIRAAIAAAAPAPGTPRLTAITFQAGGFATAPHTMLDDMMRRTGFDNQAERYGVRLTGYVPLESLIANPPQVLLAGEPEPGAPSWADRVLSHPALADLKGRTFRAVLPRRETFCGGPVLIDLAATLADARRRALEARR